MHSRLSSLSLSSFRSTAALLLSCGIVAAVVAARCSLYKCKICLDIRTRRCQRDLSVPSSKCRRRHNILYTHIIHFVYPRSASASASTSSSLFSRFIFIKIFFSFSFFVFSYLAAVVAVDDLWLVNFFDSLTQDVDVLSGRGTEPATVWRYCACWDCWETGEADENKCQRCFTCIDCGIFIVVVAVFFVCRTRAREGIYEIVT